LNDTIRAAQVLATRRREKLVGDGLPAELRPADMTAAYAIQNALVDELLEEHGGERIGYKIAFTNELIQEFLRVDGPAYGEILSHSTHASPVSVPASRFTARCIETEFGFRMKDDVPVDVPQTAESISDFVDTMLPAIEIVDHGFADWEGAGAALIAADNATHGAWVHGEPTELWRSFDLAEHEARLLVNGEVALTGDGSQVLGSPLNVLAWLANELPRHGKKLCAGDFVTTGVCTDVYLAEGPCELVADFGVLGKVELTFE
jgi:2-keto-4-pentenoate hydratase